MTWRDGTGALRSGRQMEDQAYIDPAGAVLPTLPDPLYPVGMIFRLTTNQSYWVNAAGAWVPVQAIGLAGTDRGVIQPNTVYNIGDLVTVPYGAASAGYVKAIVTTAVTSSSTRFISGSNYKRLTPRLMGINVQDFGAVGNGSTDDTAAIQAAIDYAATQALPTGQGTSVHFPGGFYITSATLVLKKHVWLVGEGSRSSCIKLAVNANCNVIKTDDTGGSSGNADYTGIINMVIDGNKANQSGAGPYHGVVYNTNPTNSQAAGDTFFDMHHTMMNVTVYKPKGNGVDCTGRSAIQLYNVHLQQCDVNGFKSTFDFTCVGVEADTCGSSGFNINNGSVKLVGCKSYLSGFNTPTTDGAGFKIGNVGPCELVGCEAQNNKLAGYNFVSADRVIMAGCNADSNNTQNSANDNERCGVSMVGSTNCIIDLISNETPQGGVQIGHQSYCLHIDNTSSNNDIRATHSAVSPATTIGEITPTSNPTTTNTIQINGIRATPIVWGPTTGVISGANADTNLYRASADKLATDDDFLINLAGKGLRVKEGTNAKMGVSTLAAGTVVVSTTAVTANSRIFLDNQTLGGTAGFLRVSARTAGTSFTILSSSNTDTSVIAWMIVEPA